MTDLVAVPEPEEPFTPLTAYFVYSDHERRVTFRWDGESPEIEVHIGGLLSPRMMRLPAPALPALTSDTATGWLGWYQHLCQTWLDLSDVEGDQPDQPG